ncbi:MAG TPA: PH domain-containing protein, partial [Euzebya sp.]|nr:PH domain-containing protein [Euzebya sp.]
RQGILVRRTTVVPVAKVQSTATHQTVFQRRLGLATLSVHIATTTRSGTVQVVDLDADLAAVRLVELLHRGRLAAGHDPPAAAILAGDARPAAGPP